MTNRSPGLLLYAHGRLTCELRTQHPKSSRYIDTNDLSLLVHASMVLPSRGASRGSCHAGNSMGALCRVDNQIAPEALLSKHVSVHSQN